LPAYPGPSGRKASRNKTLTPNPIEPTRREPRKSLSSGSGERYDSPVDLTSVGDSDVSIPSDADDDDDEDVPESSRVEYRRLILRNLPTNLRSSDVEEHFTGYDVERVVEVHQESGIAIVDLEDAKIANRALRDERIQNFRGRRLQIFQECVLAMSTRAKYKVRHTFAAVSLHNRSNTV
jgi:hypothetical protein